ncbi:MAG: hypothetical protein HQQ74_02985 [Methanoculleus bourgensis]|jgi:hypothetical protein|uniref:Uncharacterized protein n=1 Tax=Methanoculleus bourgensis TaxID=83986 RepID=A0A8T7H1H8_9EURY|nr:hypothetical protein [Methanoculleus bourgensis]
MPSFTLPVFRHSDDEQEEQGAPDLVVLVSPYETGARAVLVPRRRGDE